MHLLLYLLYLLMLLQLLHRLLQLLRHMMLLLLLLLLLLGSRCLHLMMMLLLLLLVLVLLLLRRTAQLCKLHQTRPGAFGQSVELLKLGFTDRCYGHRRRQQRHLCKALRGRHSSIDHVCGFSAWAYCLANSVGQVLIAFW